MLYGLREALDILVEEGLENVFARHHRLARRGARRGHNGWGLKLCAKEPKWYSDTVTAIMVPAGFNGADVIDVAYQTLQPRARRRPVQGRGQSCSASATSAT